VTQTALEALSVNKQEKEDIFTAFLNRDTQPKDEFETYISRPPLATNANFNPIKWWANNAKSPQMMNMAFDILSIPAMSSETERVFSGVKLTISASRNRLSEDIIEATECLNRWYKAGL
jgi:hAT family C-terminal dimerisation region